MTCQLRWIVNPGVSCLYAANLVRSNLATGNQTLTEALDDPVRRLTHILTSERVDVNRFFAAAISWAAAGADAAILGEKAASLAPSDGVTRTEVAERIAEAIRDLERAIAVLWPRLDYEVRLRERPLREQWEARGPGTLRRLEYLTGGEVAVPDAEVALVQPCLGGGGVAYPAFHIVCMEALLANPWATLPEPVRLTWFLAQLSFGAQKAESAAAPGRRAIWALATIPLVLEAAEYVEWTQYHAQTLSLALEQWPQAELNDGADRLTLAALLESWRDDWRARTSEWSLAVDDLERRIAEADIRCE